MSTWTAINYRRDAAQQTEDVAEAWRDEARTARDEQDRGDLIRINGVLYDAIDVPSEDEL